MAGETRRLAGFAASLTHEQIPARVRARAVDLLVDQLGVQIGCSALPWAQQVRALYSRAGGTPEATVVRYGDRLPACAASIINSTFGHSFEYDDANALIHGHSGAELIPPLMAIAERNHVSGRDFLTALIMAYEVRGRVGWAMGHGIFARGGPQFSTTCGPFGAAAGVARLLGLDADGIHNALSIAGTFSGGLMQYNKGGGGSVKRLYTAVGGSGGIQAACLAQEGITGPEGILEGAAGLLRIYSPEYSPQYLVADLGTLWTLEQVLFKPYCCCGIIHPAIDGLKKIMGAANLKAGDIESVEVGNANGFHQQAALTNPSDVAGMQFSTAYSLALTMVRGGNTPREYTASALQDPQVRAFASKVTVREAPDINEVCKGHLSARVRVRTTTGKNYEELVIDATGSPSRPLAGSALHDKFRSQVEDVFGAARCSELLEAVLDIGALDDMAKLPALFTVKA